MSKDIFTQSLESGGINWSVGTKEANLYAGISDREWKKVLTFYYDDVGVFYSSSLYKKIKNYKDYEEYILERIDSI